MRASILAAAAMLGMTGGMGSAELQFPRESDPTSFAGRKTKGAAYRGKKGQPGDKLGRMAADGRVGMRGQTTVYGNWKRTPREQQRIANRNARA